MKSNQKSRMSLERKRPELALKLEFLIKGQSYSQELYYKKKPSQEKARSEKRQRIDPSPVTTCYLTSILR